MKTRLHNYSVYSFFTSVRFYTSCNALLLYVAFLNILVDPTRARANLEHGSKALILFSFAFEGLIINKLETDLIRKLYMINAHTSLLV